jgi:hypothetical protein
MAAELRSAADAESEWFRRRCEHIYRGRRKSDGLRFERTRLRGRDKVTLLGNEAFGGEAGWWLRRRITRTECMRPKCVTDRRTANARHASDWCSSVIDAPVRASRASGQILVSEVVCWVPRLSRRVASNPAITAALQSCWPVGFSAGLFLCQLMVRRSMPAPLPTLTCRDAAVRVTTPRESVRPAWAMLTPCRP